MSNGDPQSQPTISFEIVCPAHLDALVIDEVYEFENTAPDLRDPSAMGNPFAFGGLGQMHPLSQMVAMLAGAPAPNPFLPPPFTKLTMRIEALCPHCARPVAVGSSLAWNARRELPIERIISERRRELLALIPALYARHVDDGWVHYDAAQRQALAETAEERPE